MKRQGMVRLLYAMAIAYFVVAIAILLPPALRRPWQESIAHLGPVFCLSSILFLIALVHSRATRRALWLMGIASLVNTAWAAGLDMLVRRADAQSIIWIAGWLLVSVASIAAARKTPPASARGRDDVGHVTN